MKHFKTDSVFPVDDNCKTVYEIAAPFIMHFLVLTNCEGIAAGWRMHETIQN